MLLLVPGQRTVEAPCIMALKPKAQPWEGKGFTRRTVEEGHVSLNALRGRGSVPSCRPEAAVNARELQHEQALPLLLNKKYYFYQNNAV